jgi:hypothetical protein
MLQKMILLSRFAERQIKNSPTMMLSGLQIRRMTPATAISGMTPDATQRTTHEYS